MRIVRIREQTVEISRFADPSIPLDGQTTSLVIVVTDMMRDGSPVVGYGFSSYGRYGQGGLIRERFGPRLLRADLSELVNLEHTNFDPLRAWDVMMKGEKPGGHGDRCVAIGTLDMAIWDIAAKIAGMPLNRYLADKLGIKAEPVARVPVYAGGGYHYPSQDIRNLTDEIKRHLDLGFKQCKIKIGMLPLVEDAKRIEAAVSLLSTPSYLAVDAMNSYNQAASLKAAAVLAPFGLWWFEDVCDPHDFETLTMVAERYFGQIAAGEALFSLAEAKLLHRHGGLRRDRDRLLFDPVHCYGLTGYLHIFRYLIQNGWRSTSFWPHGAPLFCTHVVSALHLGGAECTPSSFAPFGLPFGELQDGRIIPPQIPGIGFELCKDAYRLFELLQ